MKKYIVVKVYNTCYSSVVFSTDIKEDAVAYAEIMHRSDDQEYKIAAVL